MVKNGPIEDKTTEKQKINKEEENNTHNVIPF